MDGQCDNITKNQHIFPIVDKSGAVDKLVQYQQYHRHGMHAYIPVHEPLCITISIPDNVPESTRCWWMSAQYPTVTHICNAKFRLKSLALGQPNTSSRKYSH